MAEQTTHTLPLREEVPAKDKWHIEDIFPTMTHLHLHLKHAGHISTHWLPSKIILVIRLKRSALI